MTDKPIVHELEPLCFRVEAPWQPMVKAPKDGTPIIILFDEEWNHIEVCAWGNYSDKPNIEAWFIFGGKVGDWEFAEAVDSDYRDGSKHAIAWLPYPEWAQ